MRHEYGPEVDLVGWRSVAATPESIAALVRVHPELVVRNAVLRRSFACGDAVCESAEAATPLRGTTCSADCGTPPPRPERSELLNSSAVMDIEADVAWVSTRGQGVRVAVLDTGYDAGAASKHPDRPVNLEPGLSFGSSQDDFSDIDLHGTHVAGIIAAPANGRGMIGIAPLAGVLPIRVFTRDSGRVGASDADIIAGIQAAVKSGAKVINMSLGGGLKSELEERALAEAYRRGVLLVAASGNSEDAAHGLVRTSLKLYPGAYKEVLTVGALDGSGVIASFSSTGSSLSLAAPGTWIYSSVPMGQGERAGSLSCRVDGRTRTFGVDVPPSSSGTPLPEAALATCGFGSVADVAACKPAGKLALVQRGPAGTSAISFADKVRNARLAGATGVLLYNHRAGDPAVGGGPLTNIDIGPGSPVPVYTLAAGDGELLAQLPTDTHCSMAVTLTDYAEESGTSMAAPVVSGVAALLWSRFPALTNVGLRQLMIESAIDLGPSGFDDEYGYGQVAPRRALYQGSPRATCGNGRWERSSEMCDGSFGIPASCDDLGYDAGSIACRSDCTGTDAAQCRCLPGELSAELDLDPLALRNGVAGMGVTYHVRLGSEAVRGAQAVVTISSGGRALRVYTTGKTDAQGLLYDFIPYRDAGLAAGEYEVRARITKGAAVCHGDQPTTPSSFSIRSFG